MKSAGKLIFSSPSTTSKKLSDFQLVNVAELFEKDLSMLLFSFFFFQESPFFFFSHKNGAPPEQPSPPLSSILFLSFVARRG